MPRKPSTQGVKFMIDMDDINQLLGTVFATENLGTGSYYMRSNIRAAFGLADEEFKREITATAIASGKYAHMFEWGTVGINTAKSNIRPRPDSEQARLWKTEMAQSQKSNVISFTYKKSVGHVPLPTVKKSGIPTQITRKLKKDHVFWNKAKVMETGQTVTVTRINAPKLFIPLVYKGPEFKGKYAMVDGPTNPTPGKSEFFRSHAHTFTAAFKKFWEGRGSVMMQEQVENYFSEDLEKAIRDINRRPPGRWTPPNRVNSRGQIERAKETVTKLLTAAAEEREARNGE